MPAPIPTLPGIEETREGVRKYMAYSALGGFLFIITLIIGVGWIGLKISHKEIVEVLTATAGVLSGVVGAIIGFYFRGDEK